MNCLIVEDEPLAQEVLQTYIARLPSLTLVGTCENALDAYELLQREPVDLLFCDIQMPLVTGLELLRSLTTRPLVVLTTAFHEYALDGYDLDVVDYLLKPITFERFLRAVNRAQDRLGGPGTRSPEPPPLAASRADDHIFVKEDGRLVKILFGDIRCIEGMRDYVKIHVSGRFIVTHLTLKKLEAVLPAAEFIRVHKSYLVRQAAIRAIDGNQLELDARQVVPIGMQYREDVLRAVGRRVL
jgi:DNA-binding LytR/AlgR family response regulator